MNRRPRKVCSIEGCDRFVNARGWCITHYANWRRNGDPIAQPLTPRQRFARSTVEGPLSDTRPDLGPCLLFTGATNGNGYGQFRYNDRNGYAHRYAWESVRGPIPKGKQIDHLCRVRNCVRLEHLEVVSPLTNTRRAAEARTRCARGHKLTADNIVPGSVSECLKCQRVMARRSGRKRTKAGRGLPDTRVRYDQRLVKQQIAEVRAGRTRIAEAARVIGCNPNYLGRRIWRETKTAVFERDQRCVRCGQFGSLDAQHRKARGVGGTADPATSFGMTNLVSLCRPCHNYVETHREYARSNGYAVSQWQSPELVPVMHWLYGLCFLTPTGWEPIPKGPEGLLVVAERARQIAKDQGLDDPAHISEALHDLTVSWIQEGAA